MSISAALVKQLRERTGAGMMECKKALVATEGDIEAAVELMRKEGLAKADKKAGRIAAEGLIAQAVAGDGRTAAMVEVNSETDFVAGGEDFRSFCEEVAAIALAQRPASLDELMAARTDAGETIEEARRALVAKVGENLGVRRFVVIEGADRVGHYVHGTRIGVLVGMKGGDDSLARDIAMHVAASRPEYILESDVPAETMEKEREILTEQAQREGKPAEIVAKMVEGRLRKQLAEITLVGQPFVKDPDIKVGKLLADAGAEVQVLARFEVGEGIEKKADNFVEEVMAQVRGG